MSLIDILNNYGTIYVIVNDLEKKELFNYLKGLGFIRVNNLNSNIVVINSKLRYYNINENNISEKCIFIEYSTINKILNSKKVECYLKYKDLTPNSTNKKDLSINLGIFYITTVNNDNKLEFFKILKDNNYKWLGKTEIDVTNDSKKCNSIFGISNDNSFGYVGASIAYLSFKTPKLSFEDFKKINDTSVKGKLYIEIAGV